VLAAVLVASPWWGPRALRPLRFFGARRFEVVGARYLAPETVARALGLGERASIFEDLGLLERRVAALGGIESVHVARRLPGTLRVEIREVEPVALAEGPDGLVAVGSDGHPLPYDVTAVPVDAPLVARLDGPVVQALVTIQATDLGLYAEIAAARSRGGEVVLELTEGRVLLAPPVDAGVVRSVSAVQRDLAARSLMWRELDARYRGWVIVRRRVGQAGGGAA
jgi:hypothetical protein